MVTDDVWAFGSRCYQTVGEPRPKPCEDSVHAREFVSANVTISGAGDTTVKTGYIEQGLQVGCQIDVSSGLGVWD